MVTTWPFDGRPTGLTVMAFTSLSLAPPLILISLNKRAQTHEALVAGGGDFAINILTAGQEEVSPAFARSCGNRFETVSYSTGRQGLPLLVGALADLECRTVQRYEGGDHVIFLDEVESGAEGDGEPLLYYRGSYKQLR